ncbi:protein RodZ, contains Xre-like HTH and DUF4115 domains [Limimonas halophila]|uniref:Protein RodZ, contains Xre-like HTH and DUF4115 domains n=1 Tax=Limimonas halophila TaxID=1082479 RepID=A0A1G7PY67_9PROT|nr:RodZ domain-containing protein [Limimonas halophila]SDF91163.1 protein RodZ, contains Xre-like HTH and DUF4115 domains [Limimonas halophila]
MADEQRHLSSDPSTTPPGAEPRLDGRADGERRETAARLLRRTREMHGQDLGEIAAALRIRHAYLSAIERGAFDELPGATYAVGFVRSYAAFLELDEEEVVRRFKEDVAGLERTQELHFPEPVNEGKVPGGAVILISLVLLAVAYGGWYVLTSPGTSLSEMAPRVPDRLQALVGGGEEGAASTAGTGTSQTGGGSQSGDGSAGGEEVASTETAGSGTAVPTDGAATTSATAASDAGTQASDTGDATGVADAGESREGTGADTASAPDASSADTGAGAEADTAVDTTGDSVTVGEQTVELPDAGEDTASATAAESTNTATDTAGEQADAATAGTQAATAPDTATQTGATQTEATGSADAATGDTQADATQTAEPQAGDTQPAGDSAAQDQGGDQGAPPVPGAESDDGGAGATQTASAPSGRAFGAAAGDEALVLRATADSWVQVRGANGDVLVSRVLEPGDVYRVPERDGLRLHTGNAGGLTVEAEGRAVRTLGDAGEVRRNIALTPANLLNGG